MNKHLSTFKVVNIASAALLAVSMLACSGEDRSDEQPFAPSVITVGATQKGDSTVLLEGLITASPNSTLKQCGFNWGTISTSFTTPTELQNHFTLTIDTLSQGNYYAVAYATNYMGTSYGDTVCFEIK